MSRDCQYVAEQFIVQRIELREWLPEGVLGPTLCVRTGPRRHSATRLAQPFAGDLPAAGIASKSMLSGARVPSYVKNLEWEELGPQL